MKGQKRTFFCVAAPPHVLLFLVDYSQLYDGKGCNAVKSAPSSHLAAVHTSTGRVGKSETVLIHYHENSNFFTIRQNMT